MNRKEKETRKSSGELYQLRTGVRAMGRFDKMFKEAKAKIIGRPKSD